MINEQEVKKITYEEMKQNLPESAINYVLDIYSHKEKLRKDSQRVFYFEYKKGKLEKWVDISVMRQRKNVYFNVLIEVYKNKKIVYWHDQYWLSGVEIIMILKQLHLEGYELTDFINVASIEIKEYETNIKDR